MLRLKNGKKKWRSSIAGHAGIKQNYRDLLLADAASLKKNLI